MNKPPLPLRWRGLAALPALAFATLAATLPLGAGDTGPATEPGYELFIGLDVFVHADDASGRVRQVSRGKVEIVVDGERQRIPVRGLVIEHLDHTVKVSTTRVSIHDVLTECVATTPNPGNDDMFRDMAMDRIQEEQDRRLEDDRMEFATENAIPQNREQAMEIKQMKEQISQRKRVEAARAISTRSYLDTLLNTGNEDPARNTATLKASFTISASRPVSDAYVAVFARLRNPVDPRAAIHRVVFQEIRNLGSRPTSIKIEKDGVPPASVIELFEIHVYAGDRELSSNLAHGRVQVSRDEAVEFMRLQRLNLHPGESLPPEIMPQFLSAHAARVIPPDQSNRSVRVSLDGQGNVTAVALTSAEPGPTDAAIEAMIRALPFLPAQEGGEPIASELTLTLGELIE